MVSTGIKRVNKSRKGRWSTTKKTSLALLIMSGLYIGLFSVMETSTVNKIFSTKQSYLVSGQSSEHYQQLQTQLAKLNIIPSHQLGIINTVAVELTEQQLTRLEQQIDIRVSVNHQVKLSGKAVGQRKWQPEAVVADFISASSAHATGNYGGAVTIGFLDTGLDKLTGLDTDRSGRDKYWGTYNAINNTISNNDHESNGHGTHVASIAGNSDLDKSNKVYGVAPSARLVGIKAFDNQGKATYADVIRGIQWAVLNKDQINLKVLNMSFSGPVYSYYWEDPLNQAVMKAWQSGIVVVASAGNRGPDPMTIGVPGNLPYIITVGAMTDNYTPDELSDDKLAIFSSAGPTVEGFVKPEIIAPGGHMSGLMAQGTQIVSDHPEFHDGGRYYEMSGTSQATAVVSGVVALMLTADSTLTPDEVKCRLVASARPAMRNDGKLAYSVFQQGAGVVDAAEAIGNTASNCANQSLDIAKDLAGEKHFYGPANINSDGDFYIEGLDNKYIWDIPVSLENDSGFIWRTALKSDSGFIWRTSVLTDSGFIWRTAVDSDTATTNHDNFITDSGFIWRTSVMTDSGFIWRTSVDIDGVQGIGVNNWVEQQ